MQPSSPAGRHPTVPSPNGVPEAASVERDVADPAPPEPAAATPTATVAARRAEAVRRLRRAAAVLDPVEWVAAAAFATLTAVALAGHHAVVYADSPSYLRLDFLGRQMRLWTVPLIFKAAGNNGGRVVVQTV